MLNQQQSAVDAVYEGSGDRSVMSGKGLCLSGVLMSGLQFTFDGSLQMKKVSFLPFSLSRFDFLFPLVKTVDHENTSMISQQASEISLCILLTDQRHLKLHAQVCVTRRCLCVCRRAAL